MKKAYESAKWDDKDIRMAQRKGARKQERDNSKVEKDFQYKRMKERSEKFQEIKDIFKEKCDSDIFKFGTEEFERMARSYEFIEKIDDSSIFTIESRLDSVKSSIENVVEEVEETEERLDGLKDEVES